MNHFKISIETGKKLSIGRIIYVRSPDIIAALDISKKFRGASLKSIVPITFEEYMNGVSKKYDRPQASD